MRKTTTCYAVVAAVWMLAMSVGYGAEPGDFAGTWVMRLGQRNLFVLTLMPDGDAVRGGLERPAEFTSQADLIFTGMRGVRHDRVVRSRLVDGALHLTLQNGDGAGEQYGYAMVVRGNRAELAHDGMPAGIVMQPCLLERAPAEAKVATDWEPNRAYTSNDSDAPSAEMQAIFDEDQRPRQGGDVDWQEVSRKDAERRDQTRRLLTLGSLHTGKDYEMAAFVFQHGDSPQDYLLAHTLAMVAVSKGEATAIWIAAATLDRYLRAIGREQVFGTTYARDSRGVWTQEPYDRELISDALRQQLGIPSQAAQAEQLRAYQTQK